MMKPLIRPIPAHSTSRNMPVAPAAVSYVNNTVEPRDPVGPHWLSTVLKKLFKVELVKL